METGKINQSIENIKYNWKSPDHKPPFANTQEFKINGDTNEEVMRIAVGTKGCHFYRITEDNNIPYIFHDKEINKIVIWSPICKAQRVISEINRQLNWARNIVKKNNEKNSCIEVVDLLSTTS